MNIRRGQPLGEQVADELRKRILDGTYTPGGQLPSERELREEFGVSQGTVRAAIVQLNTEGWTVTQHGRGTFVVPEADRPLRRMDKDISGDDGFYTMLRRSGLTPNTTTTVHTEPASAVVAEALGISEGEEVTVRHRVMRAEGRKTLNLATSYFPAWVIRAAPELADPEAHGMPSSLRRAFGETYSQDIITCRLVRPEEVEPLEVEPGSPVLTIKGYTRNQQHRPLHVIFVVVPPDRMPVGYEYGVIPPKQ